MDVWIEGPRNSGSPLLRFLLLVLGLLWGLLPGGVTLLGAQGELLSPPPPLEEPSQPPLPPQYQVGPEDVLEILVWRNEHLSVTVTVRPDGKISMPLLGDIQAAGQTPAQIQQQITERLREFIQNPRVAIIVREVNSRAFYILGEIAQPGKYPLNTEITILQAIALAGGFTEWADKNRIILLRKRPGHPEGERIEIRYRDILSGADPKANVVLEPGDTIIVP